MIEADLILYNGTIITMDSENSIEVCKLADFVVLGDELLTVPSEKIKDIEVEMTFIYGEMVYTSIDKYLKYVRTPKSI